MIRFAVPEDCEDLAVLHFENVRRTYKNIYDESFFRTMSLEQYISDTDIYLRHRNIRTIVFEEGSEIQGFASVRFHTKRGVAILDYLHVKKSAENCGVGKKLFGVVCGVLLSEQIEKIEVSCVDGNDKARKFYQKFDAEYIGSYLYGKSGKPHFSNRLQIDNLQRFAVSTELSLGLKDEYEKLKCYMKNDFVLWGAGYYYNLFVGQFKNRKAPKYFFDNDERIQGLCVNGVKVVKPRKTELPIIITCSKYDEIEADIKQMGCESYVGYYPWHNYCDL